jgi:thiol-disulfide isomerase/thioredoxin
MKNFTLFLVFLFLLLGCGAKKKSNLDVDKFTGTTLSGEKIVFTELKMQRVVWNVYSQTCVPCFKEIPALNYIQTEMKRQNLGQIYMVVDPAQIFDNTQKLSKDAVFQKVKEIMTLEKTKRNIELPIVVMDEPFKVTPGEGFVTGTPETLLFKTSPFILYYNFIGSVSDKEKLEDIIADPKVHFFIRLLGGV